MKYDSMIPECRRAFKTSRHFPFSWVIQEEWFEKNRIWHFRSDERDWAGLCSAQQYLL